MSPAYVHLVGRPAVRRSPPQRGTVIGALPVTPRMRRVTVHAEAMRGVEIRPAQDVELWLRDSSGRRVKRRYTIRHARPDAGELDLDILLHGCAPGADWGAVARPGDEIEFQGPRGKLELRPAPWHVLVGDESAVPAIAAICEALPADEKRLAVIEVQSEADEVPIDADTRWVHRDQAPPGTADVLRGALAEIDVPQEAHAYLLGETRAMVEIRAEVEARGVEHGAVFVKGYWNVGRPDRLAGTAPTVRSG